MAAVMAAVVALAVVGCSLLLHPVQTAAAAAEATHTTHFERVPRLADVAPSMSHNISFSVAHTEDRLACLLACSRLSTCASVVWAEPQCFLMRRVLGLADLGTSLLETRPGASYWQRQERGCAGAEGYTAVPSLNLCLRLYLQLRDWNAARSACQAEGGDLAGAKTQEKRQILNRDFNAPGDWRWLATYVLNGRHVWMDGTEVNPGWYTEADPTKHCNLHWSGAMHVGPERFTHFSLCEVPLAP